jgi:hypothetical protein
MNLAELMGAARVIQNPLGRSRLTGIDMSGDADVSHSFERDIPWHKNRYKPLFTAEAPRKTSKDPSASLRLGG